MTSFCGARFINNAMTVKQMATSPTSTLLLIALIAAMIAAFARIDRPAALLQIPYVLWCGFAAVLCRAVALLNP